MISFDCCFFKPSDPNSGLFLCIVFTSSQEYETARQELLRRYNEVARGPAKVLVMNVFLEKVTAGVVRGLFEGLTGSQKQVETLGKRVAELESGATRHREVLIGLEKDLEYQKKESATLSQEFKRRGEELQQERDKVSATSRDLGELRHKLAAAEAEVTTSRRAHEASTKEFHTLQQREREIEGELRNFKERAATLDGQLRETSEKSSKESTQRDKALGELNNEVNLLRQQNQQAQQQLGTSRRELEEQGRRTEEQQRLFTQSHAGELTQARSRFEGEVSRLEGDKAAILGQLQKVQGENTQLQVRSSVFLDWSPSKPQPLFFLFFLFLSFSFSFFLTPTAVASIKSPPLFKVRRPWRRNCLGRRKTRRRMSPTRGPGRKTPNRMPTPLSTRGNPQ